VNVTGTPFTVAPPAADAVAVAVTVSAPELATLVLFSCIVSAVAVVEPLPVEHVVLPGPP
jgi:hypothetical protein